jgi:hypothetical protein
MDAGHGTETLQRWREKILYFLTNKYLVRDHSEAAEDPPRSNQPMRTDLVDYRNFLRRGGAL